MYLVPLVDTYSAPLIPPVSLASHFPSFNQRPLSYSPLLPFHLPHPSHSSTVSPLPHLSLPSSYHFLSVYSPHPPSLTSSPLHYPTSNPYSLSSPHSTSLIPPPSHSTSLIPPPSHSTSLSHLPHTPLPSPHLPHPSSSR